MVKVQIDDTYWLLSDKREWLIAVLEEEARFRVVERCISLGVALDTYRHMKMLESGAETWEELKQDAEILRSHIYKIMQKIDRLAPEIKQAIRAGKWDGDESE